MKIRHAKQEDIPKAYKLVMRGFEKFVAPTIKPKGGNTFRKFNTEDGMRKRMKEKGKIVGYLETNKNSFALFFVQPSKVGKGIGRMLFDKAQNLLKKNGSKFIHVNASLSAVDVYSKLGFKKTTGIRIKDGVIYQPMKKILN